MREDLPQPAPASSTKTSTRLFAASYRSDRVNITICSKTSSFVLPQRLVPDAYDPVKRAQAEEKQKTRIAEIKRQRDNAGVEACLKKLEDAARDTSTNILPPLVECVKAYTTVREMTRTLKRVFGEHEGYGSL